MKRLLFSFQYFEYRIYFSFLFIVVNPTAVMDIMVRMVGEGKRKLED